MPWILGIGEQPIRHSHDVSNVKNRHPTPQDVEWTPTAGPGITGQTRAEGKDYTGPCRLAPWSDQPWVVAFKPVLTAAMPRLSLDSVTRKPCPEFLDSMISHD